MRIFAPSGRPSKLRRMSDQFSKALAGGEDGKGVKNPETGTATISFVFTRSAIQICMMYIYIYIQNYTHVLATDRQHGSVSGL